MSGMGLSRRFRLGVVLAWISLQAAAAQKFRVLPYANNIFGRVPNPRQDGTNVTYLGEVQSVVACESLCTRKLGDSCNSYTWHSPQFNPKWATQCYGTTDHVWLPFAQGNVTSAQRDPTQTQSPCSTDADCSYNGKCGAAGVCECKSQWMGYRCAQLNTVPSNKTLGLQSRMNGQRVSSWGGSVWWDEASQLFHMWAAEMADFCGIRLWRTQSIVRHATSPSLDEPFEPQEIVAELWSHEPTVAVDRRTNPPTYVMYWSTTQPEGNIPCTGKTCSFCANGNSPSEDPEPGPCPDGSHCTLQTPLYTKMAFSSGPDGPWSEPILVPRPNGMGDSNLSPLIQPDGSLIALARPPWVYVASDWRNVSSYSFFEAQGSLDGEDPYVWVSDGVLHALFHGGGWSDPHGYHFFSTDNGQSWAGYNDVVYSYDLGIEHLTGGTLSLSRRERPHLVLGPESDGESGEPLALTNGVTPSWPCDAPDECPVDYCYTSLQLLNQA